VREWLQGSVRLPQRIAVDASCEKYREAIAKRYEVRVDVQKERPIIPGEQSILNTQSLYAQYNALFNSKPSAYQNSLMYGQGITKIDWNKMTGLKGII
jgi:hypothetical protein